MYLASSRTLTKLKQMQWSDEKMIMFKFIYICFICSTTITFMNIIQNYIYFHQFETK